MATQFAHLHRDAVARLGEWEAPDAAQLALRERFLAHLARFPDGVARTGPPVHLTVGLVVLSRDLRSVLLTHHRKARQWYQFGGHLEPTDATVAGAAEREGAEESGVAGLSRVGGIVHLDAHTLPATFGTCREHLDVRYVALAPPDAVHAVSEESLDVRWWPVDALPGGTDAELGPLVRSARRFLQDRATPGHEHG